MEKIVGIGINWDKNKKHTKEIILMKLSQETDDRTLNSVLVGEYNWIIKNMIE